MKILKSILVVTMLLILSNGYSQTFIKSYGGTGYDEGASVYPTSDCGYIVVGNTESFGSGGKDIYIVKVDEEGNVEWSKVYGGANDDNALGVVELEDGSFFICGNTKSYGFGVGTLNKFNMRISSTGSLIWFKVVGGTNLERGGGIMQAENGTLINVGATWSYTGADMLLESYHPDGTLLKSYRYNYTSAVESDGFNEILQLPSGKFVIAGQSEDYYWGDHDAWIMITDTNFNALSTIFYGGSGREYAFSICYNGKGKIAVTGDTDGYGAGGRDYYLAVFDTSGNLEFFKTYGGTGRDEPVSVVCTPDGGYAMLGQTQSYGAGGFDMMLIKTDSTGRLEWARTYGGTGNEFLDRAASCNTLMYNNGFVFTTTSNGYGGSGYEMVLFKTDSLGFVDGCTVNTVTPSVGTHTVSDDDTWTWTRYPETWDSAISLTNATHTTVVDTACDYSPRTDNYLITDDTTICEGETVMLEAIPGYSYVWSPSTGLSDPTIANPVASPSSTTTYILTIMNAYGCTNWDTVTVSVSPAPDGVVSPSDTTIICYDSPSNTQIFTASGGTSYTWYPSTYLSGTTGSSVTYTAPTMEDTSDYYVVVENSAGCKDTAYFTVVAVEGPSGSLSPSMDTIVVCYDIGAGTQMLTISGGVTYTWSPATYLSGTGGATVTYTAPSMYDTTDYFVIVEDANMCLDTIFFTMISNRCNTSVNGIDMFGSGVEVYPNPSTGIFTIRLNEIPQTTIRVRITNVLGEIIDEQLLEVGKREYDQVVDIESYSAGVYILTLDIDDQIISRKLIKE